jgi:hypothetical protein
LVIHLRGDQVSTEELIVYGVVILGSAGGVQFPAQAQVQCQIRLYSPIVLTVYAPEIVSDVPIANAFTNT